MELKIDNIKIFIPEDYKEEDNYVMQVIVPQPAGRIGGSDTHVLQLSTQQKENGLLKPIVLFCRNPEYEQKLRSLEIGYISCVSEHKVGKMLKSLGKVPFINKIKIIHSHQYNANYLTYVLKKKYRKSYGKIPTVMTCHGWIENNFHDRFFTMLDFASYAEADALITVCDKDLKRLQRKAKYRKKVLTNIRNGVTSPKEFNKDDINDFQIKYNLDPSLKTIAYVGRLAPEKRIDGYLNCCKELIDKGHNLNYLVVGSGDEENKLKELSKQLGIADKINFVGFINPVDIVYSVVNLLLLTSDTEGTPRCVLEAMAAGVPVIATNVGGLHEIIDGSNGYLVDKGDYCSMAHKVDSLIKDDNKLSELSEKSKETIKKYFDIKDMQEKIDKVYQNILKEG